MPKKNYSTCQIKGYTNLYWRINATCILVQDKSWCDELKTGVLLFSTQPAFHYAASIMEKPPLNWLTT